MSENNKAEIIDQARNDYILGMKYKDISKKLKVSENTIKSWKKRYGWERNCTTKKVGGAKKVQKLGNTLYDEIKADLLLQLKLNETEEKRYVDLVSDYMALWEIKNGLIADVKQRGLIIEWFNGKQSGEKKNESVSELIKVNAQMLKILNDLNLKPSPKIEDDDDI